MSRVLKIIALEKQGSTSGIFAMIPFWRDMEKVDTDEVTAFVRERVLERLRFDREEHLCGAHVLDKNPSCDPSEVHFYYTATMEKQAIYRNLPHDVGESYRIIDAFVCLGSRFGLDPLQVFVEVCESKLGGGRIWANVYYVADSEVPVCVIHVREWTNYGGIPEVEAKNETKVGMTA